MKPMIIIARFVGRLILAFAVAAFFWLPWLSDWK